MALPREPRVRPFPLADLPRIGRAQAEAVRALMARLPVEPGAEWRDACRLVGDMRLRLTEIWAIPARDLLATARGAVVKLALPGQRWALIAIDGQLAPRLCRRALGVSDPELGGPRPLTLAEEGALEFLVAALVGPAAQVTGLLGDAGVAALLPTLGDGWLAVAQAALETPHGDGWARLVAPDALKLAAEPPRPLATLAAHAARLDGADATLALEAGRTSVGRADLAALAPGDVVLFESAGRALAPSRRPVTLRLGRGGFAAHLDGGRLHVDDAFLLRGGASTPAATPGGAGTMDADASSTDQLLRELPVEVACELGRVTMSGRELLELRPGAVIPVGRPLSGPVDLTVGSRVVARGELVDVDGEMGVRVTQICE